MWFCGSTNASIRGPWWVGDTRVTTPCESGERASFTIWPSAEVGQVIQRPTSLGSPSSASATTFSQTITSRSASFPASSAPYPTANATNPAAPIDRASVPVTNQPSGSSESESARRQSLALGTGLGIPLGIACVALLAFLLRNRRQQKGKWKIGDETFAQARKPDRELDYNRPPGELSGSEAGQELWQDSPRPITEIDSQQNYELNAR